MNRFYKYFHFLFALCLGWLASPSGLAQTQAELLRDPTLYTLVLWNDFLQKEGLTAQVEDSISQAKEILKRADLTQKQMVFTKLYDETFQSTGIKILISQTPDDHLTEEGHVAISFTAFLEAPLALASRVAYLLALQTKGTLQSTEPETARQWVRAYLSIPPELPSFKAQTDYGKILRGESRLRLEYFISTKELENHTLRFRILDDGLIVPVERDSALLAFLEGSHQNDPIEEVALARLLNSIELQITASLIKDIKLSEMDNERSMMIWKGLTSFLIWSLFDRRLKLLKNGLFRKPARILTFIGGFFVIDGAIDKAAEASGLGINAGNLEKRAKYEKVLLFLTKSFEEAKLGILNTEQFKREFCAKLGLDLTTVSDLHLFDDEAEWAASIEGKLTEYYTKKTVALKTYLEKVTSWLDRIARAKKIKDPNTGLFSYKLPARTPSLLEQTSDTVFSGGALIMVGEYAYTKFYKMKRLLYSGRIFGGVALSALTINYLLGVSAQEPITLPEDQKMKLEFELLELQKRLPELIQTYELLSQKI